MRCKSSNRLIARPIATPNSPLENAQLELFVKWIQSCSSETKRPVSMKLQEIMHPASTMLTQPQLKIKTKGCPKVDTSTRCLPSAFEVVLFGQDSAHLTDKVVTRPPRKKPKTIPQKRPVFNSQTQPLPYVNPKKRPSKLPVYLEGQHPMPPVDERWLRCATITASDWFTPYQDRIRQFRYEAGVEEPYDNDPIFIE
ncbi:unnamed protein product [Prunus brigantina]